MKKTTYINILKQAEASKNLMEIFNLKTTKNIKEKGYSYKIIHDSIIFTKKGG